jgi:hypothetical protein
MSFLRLFGHLEEIEEKFNTLSDDSNNEKESENDLNYQCLYIDIFFRHFLS